MSKLWWRKNWGSDKTCGISYTRLRPGKNNIGIGYTTKLKCGHRFYTIPLMEWYTKCGQGKSTCPNCRKLFELSDLLQT
jgi:hypothetical protein